MEFKWRHNIQPIDTQRNNNLYNDIEHNDIRHDAIQHDEMQHIFTHLWHSDDATTISILTFMKWHAAYYRSAVRNLT